MFRGTWTSANWCIYFQPRVNFTKWRLSAFHYRCSNLSSSVGLMSWPPWQGKVWRVCCEQTHYTYQCIYFSCRLHTTSKKECSKICYLVHSSTYCIAFAAFQKGKEKSSFLLLYSQVIIMIIITYMNKWGMCISAAMLKQISNLKIVHPLPNAPLRRAQFERGGPGLGGLSSPRCALAKRGTDGLLLPTSGGGS